MLSSTIRASWRVAPRTLGIVAAGMLLASLAPAATAQEQPADANERLDAIEQRLAEQEQENARLRQELETLQDRAMSADPDASDATPSAGPVRDRAARQLGRLGTQGGFYAKPFLTRVGGAHVGGYFDLEHKDSQDNERTFLQHRLIPFIFGEITDTIRFGAEIEFEYGGPDIASADGEVKVEYAALDWELWEAFGIRAGAILAPIGKFNLVHDSPVNDLTDRPLVNRYIIPTTLTEAGIGIFGTIAPVGDFQIDYEAYLTNGFQGLVEDSTAPTGYTSNFSTAKGIRSGRPSLKNDNNNSVAFVGRVALSPLLGTELGGSIHLGRYDAEGENWMRLWAVDATLQLGRFTSALSGLELLGELAVADLERNGLARSSGVPGDMWGVYGQANYHFMFEGLKDALPNVFPDESTFTAVSRLDYVDLDGNDSQRLTWGLNYRPVEDTVFKLSYQYNFEEWDRTRVHNDAWVFSVASYF